MLPERGALEQSGTSEIAGARNVLSLGFWAPFYSDAKAAPNSPNKIFQEDLCKLHPSLNSRPSLLPLSHLRTVFTERPFLKIPLPTLPPTDVVASWAGLCTGQKASSLQLNPPAQELL